MNERVIRNQDNYSFGMQVQISKSPAPAYLPSTRNIIVGTRLQYCTLSKSVYAIERARDGGLVVANGISRWSLNATVRSRRLH
jgi:hypothetical protein